MPRLKISCAVVSLLLFLWSKTDTLAQADRLTIHVYDQVTKQPIPFVHVKVKGKERAGTTTDTRGAFYADSFGENEVLIFSHVSYQTEEISLSSIRRTFSVYLVQNTQELAVFEFSAGENPALPFVRKAIQNRELNNPDRQDSYRYSSYNKVVMTIDGLIENPEVDDTTVNFLKGGHLFMTESYSEVRYRRPGRRNETVKASKVSGIENPTFAALSTTFQPFSVYTDHIRVLEIPYVNPISQDGMRKYEYFLEDSLQTDAGTAYLISYQPKPGKSHHLGKGLVYISSQNFALENFLLKPADESGQILFEIQQKNRYDGQHWFPEQLNSIYVFNELDVSGRKAKLVNQTFLSDVGINDLGPDQKISPVSVTYDLTKDYDWSALRKDSLSTREFLTYQRFDELDAKTKLILNKGADLISYLSTGRIKLGVVDLLPRRILRLNEYERFGLGLGLSTNQTLSDFFRVEGYFRYGTRDQAWKYGGLLSLYLHPDQDAKLLFSYSQDIDEPGRSILGTGRTFATAGHLYRNFQANRMDLVERYAFEYTQMPLPGFRYRLIGSVENRQQQFGYALTAPPDEFPAQFTATEATLELNYTGSQSTTRIGNELVALTLSYPVIGLRVSKAIPDLFGGNQDFVNTEFRVQHQWSSGNSLHQLHLSAQGVWGSDLPISYLNTGYGVRAQDSNRYDLPVSFAGYLQTMQIYEFFSDRSAHINYAYLTGPLFVKKAKGISVAPQLKFHQSFAIGTLSDPGRYSFVPFKTMEKGFWESGLELTNLIKLTSGIQIQGWGVGVFYRYGPYALPDSRDNLRFTLSLTAGI